MLLVTGSGRTRALAEVAAVALERTRRPVAVLSANGTELLGQVCALAPNFRAAPDNKRGPHGPKVFADPKRLRSLLAWDLGCSNGIAPIAAMAAIGSNTCGAIVIDRADELHSGCLLAIINKTLGVGSVTLSIRPGAIGWSQRLLEPFVSGARRDYDVLEAVDNLGHLSAGVNTRTVAKGITYTRMCAHAEWF